MFFKSCAPSGRYRGSGSDQRQFSKAVELFRSANRSLGDQPTVEQLKLLVSLHVIATSWRKDGHSEFPRRQSNSTIDETDEGLRSKDQVDDVTVWRGMPNYRSQPFAEFVHGMERRRLTTHAGIGILSNPDGRQLAQELRSSRLYGW